MLHTCLHIPTQFESFEPFESFECQCTNLSFYTWHQCVASKKARLCYVAWSSGKAAKAISANSALSLCAFCISVSRFCKGMDWTLPEFEASWSHLAAAIRTKLSAARDARDAAGAAGAVLSADARPRTSAVDTSLAPRRCARRQHPAINTDTTDTTVIHNLFISCLYICMHFFAKPRANQRVTTTHPSLPWLPWVKPLCLTRDEPLWGKPTSWTGPVARSWRASSGSCVCPQTCECRSSKLTGTTQSALEKSRSKASAASRFPPP